MDWRKGLDAELRQLQEEMDVELKLSKIRLKVLGAGLPIAVKKLNESPFGKYIQKKINLEPRRQQPIPLENSDLPEEMLDKYLFIRRKQDERLRSEPIFPLRSSERAYQRARAALSVFERAYGELAQMAGTSIFLESVDLSSIRRELDNMRDRARYR